MARLHTSGFELQEAQVATTRTADAAATGTASPTITTSTVRSGAAAAQCASGAGNATSYVTVVVTNAASTSYYGRCYLNFAQLPGSTVAVAAFGAIGTGGASVRCTSTGDLQLWDEKNGAQLGSLAGSALSTGTWYMIEISITTDASNNITSAAARLDGTQFASGSPATPGLIGGGQYLAGWLAAPGATKTVYVDDIAVNDSTGSAQTSWPGSGKVVLLIPTADSAIGTGWTNDNAATTNLFNSVKATPPAGIADTTAGGGGHQIRNATANANVNYDATMTTYTAAGVGASDTINLLDPIIATAAPVATSAKAGTVGVASNPTIANVNLGAAGTAGAFWSGAAQAAYNTTGSWKWSHGTVTYAPTVTLGTAPVMRVTQVTSSTRIASVCFMGMYVDYTPAVVAPTIKPKPLIVMQAVNRAASW